MWRIFLISVVFLVGCSKSYVTVQRQRVGKSSLASNFVQSPDPRKENPQRGQKLIVKWRVPSDVLAEDLSLKLSMVFKDYKEEVFEREIHQENGYIVYDLVGERFEETGGFLTYKAEVVTESGKVIESWRQQLWVEIIEPPQLLIDPELSLLYEPRE